MKIHVSDILEGLNLIAPFELAESWDNVGLLIGDPGRVVHSLLLGLDPSLSLLDEAISRGIDTLITHHPCIFRPFPSVNVTTPDGAFLERALTHKINVIACHTNFDSAENGVSDALAKLFGLEDVCPLRLSMGEKETKTGMGRIGSYVVPLSFSQFMQRVFQAFESDTLQIAGPQPSQIMRVALCGGSGSDLAEEAFRQHADIYLSSEVKHSTAVWAENAGFCIVNGTHYATEKPSMVFLGRQITELGREMGWDLDIHQATSEKAAFLNIYSNSFY
jgi:dinuclear metal center YbgI/SA1388 family protein